MGLVELEGAAHLVLARGVRHLDEEPAVFEGMLAGWERQQLSRYLQEATIGPRLRMVRGSRVHRAVPVAVGAGGGGGVHSSLVSGQRPVAHSTVRGTSWRCGCSASSSPIRRYGWAEECERAVRAGAGADLP